MGAAVSEFELFQPVNFGFGLKKELPQSFTAELEQVAGVGVIAVTRTKGEPRFLIPLVNVAYFKMA